MNHPRTAYRSLRRLAAKSLEGPFFAVGAAALILITALSLGVAGWRNSRPQAAAPVPVSIDSSSSSLIIVAPPRHQPVVAPAGQTDTTETTKPALAGTAVGSGTTPAPSGSARSNTAPQTQIVASPPAQRYAPQSNAYNPTANQLASAASAVVCGTPLAPVVGGLQALVPVLQKLPVGC